jgi:hypothetical protein
MHVFVSAISQKIEIAIAISDTFRHSGWKVFLLGQKQMSSEIYAIANLGSVRFYVGQVQHLKTRWPKMMLDLEQGTFPNQEVLAAWQANKQSRRFTFHTAEDVNADLHLYGRKLFLKDLSRETSPPHRSEQL